MILDDIRTRFLGGDLYARATYTRVYMVVTMLVEVLSLVRIGIGTSALLGHATCVLK